MKKFAIIALAIAIALPASAAGVTISGYLDLGYWASQNPNFGVTVAGGPNRLQASTATNGSWSGNNQFNINEANVDISSQLTTDISAFISVDFVNGAAGAIDYAYLDFANPGPFDLNVRVGRVPSVIGIEQRVSEANQTKFINLSLLSPITVGSQDGVAIYGSFSPVNYAVAVTNNDNIGPASIGTNPLRPGNNNGAVGATIDNNNNRAISGRIGVVPIEGLELGISASSNVWAAPVGAGALLPDNKNPYRNIVTADASYAWGAFTIKGEYATVKEQQLYKNTGIPVPITANGYYIEGWYDWTSKFGLGVRYNRVNMKQTLVGVAPATGNTSFDRVSDYNTLSVAGQYKIADNVAFKAEYDINREPTVLRQNTSGRETHNDVIAASLVGSF